MGNEAGISQKKIITILQVFNIWQWLFYRLILINYIDVSFLFILSTYLHISKSLHKQYL